MAFPSVITGEKLSARGLVRTFSVRGSVAVRSAPQARPLLSFENVLVLEARFHPQQLDGAETIVVGHVVWDEDESNRPTVQPSMTLMRQAGPATTLSKLQYLVATAAPDAFRHLMGLKSRYWSFVDVSSRFTRKGGW
jgi:hypothetical protein